MANATRPARWLLRRPKDDAPARLFCFPYSGVGASMYSAWPERVGPAEVCLVQTPGRENRIREPHFGSFEALADQLAEALLPHLDRPFAFFGHCGGALPGFALAVHLHQCGLPTPARIFISSQVAPHEAPYGRFLSMTDDELEVELSELTRALGVEPHPDLVKLGLSVLRADLEAQKRYRLARPVVLPSAFTVIGWADDKEVPPALVGGWTEYGEQGAVRFVTLPGAHYEFLSAPRLLLDEMAADMTAAALVDSRP